MANACALPAVQDRKISSWYPFAYSAALYPTTIAIWSRERIYTFAEAQDQSARYAQWMLSEGIRPGELVAMYLMNSSEFLVIWLAILSIGCSPAFLNYNLEGKALIHCLDVCETKLIIADDDPGCRARIEGVRDEIEKKGKKLIFLDNALQREISATKAVVPGDEYRRDVTGEFPCCLIYTRYVIEAVASTASPLTSSSGTTGLPKGCAFTSERLRLLAPNARPRMFDQMPGPGGDRWYNCMPLYHGTGAMSSIAALMGGIGVAVGKKFSVTNFWKDIHDSEATFFVYVGETARYLLNAPPSPYERDHKVRCCYGNGMRPDVWEKFKARFNIPEVAEFFNSTEGMFALLNYDKGEFFSACVGHHGLVLRTALHNMYVPVKIDHETGDIWRDLKTGFGKRMLYEEGGEIVVNVPSEKAFQGYWRAEEATKKMFVRDLFKKGDIYYRTGDALRRDGEGRWYFMDRLGDTFRWKSENVSTAEVAIVLGQYPGVAEANVYGVLIPNHDGRAGCAAVHLASDHKGPFDYNDLLRFAKARLPRYAVPVFIRKVEAITHIHNHKQNKVPLRKEGVCPSMTGTEVKEGKNDKFLWVPPRADQYVEFTESDWKALEAGQARL